MSNLTRRSCNNTPIASRVGGQQSGRKLVGVNQNRDDADAIIHPCREGGESPLARPQASRSLLLDDGSYEHLPRYVYKNMKTSKIYYKPTAGTTTLKVKSADGQSPVEYVMTKDVIISSISGYTLESINRIRAVKECVEGGNDLLMVWAAKLFKAWQTLTSVRLRRKDTVTVEWGIALSRQKIQALVSTLVDMNVTDHAIDIIVNHERRFQRLEVSASAARENAGCGGDAPSGAEESTIGTQCTPSSDAVTSKKKSVSKRTSGKRRASVSPESTSERLVKKKKALRVQVEIKAATRDFPADDAAAGDVTAENVATEQDTGERELQEIRGKREEIMERSKLIGINREQTLRSAEEAFARGVEEAKKAYDEALRQSEELLGKAKQQAEERYQQGMGAVEARKQDLFRVFWGQQ